MVGISANPLPWVLFIWGAGVTSGLLVLLFLWWYRSRRKLVGLVGALLVPVSVALWVGYWTTSADRRQVDALSQDLIELVDPSPDARVKKSGISSRTWCPASHGIQESDVFSVNTPAVTGPSRSEFSFAELEAMEQIVSRLEDQAWTATRAEFKDLDGVLLATLIKAQRAEEHALISMSPGANVTILTHVSECLAERQVEDLNNGRSRPSDFRTGE